MITPEQITCQNLGDKTLSKFLTKIILVAKRNESVSREYTQ